MTCKMNMLLPLLALLTWGVALPGWARQSEAALTLDQAVERVQQETGGTVLSAEPRQFGHKVEYRVKVLTPNGHVRVVRMMSDVVKSPTPVPSIKSSTGDGRGTKEKH